MTLDAIFDFIESHIAERGYGPTNSEIQEATGLRSSTIHEQLHKLRASGRIDFADREHRTITIPQRTRGS